MEQTQQIQATRRKVNIGTRYLNFRIEDESYGIEILRVKELMGMTEITPIPQTPPFIRGFINLRGQIIPIIDLRLKFSLEFKAYTKRTSIIVAEIPSDDGPGLMGLVVDAINDVVAVPDDRVSRIPYINAKIKQEFVIGVATLDTGVMVLLDVVKILKSNDFVQLKDASEALAATGVS